MQLIAFGQNSAPARVQVLRHPEGARGRKGSAETCTFEDQRPELCFHRGNAGVELHWDVKMLSPPWQSLKDFQDGDLLELF